MNIRPEMKTVFLFIAFSICCSEIFSQTTIVPFGSSWKYLDNGSNQGTAWRGTGFSDAGWASGNGELGYGDGDETTTVSFGGNSSNKYITTYFRKTVNIPNPAIYTNFTMRIAYDDGFAVYVNGTEVGRVNLAAGAGYTTTSPSAVEETITTITVPSSSFVAGNNVIAVEMHQQSATSSDISFDLELKGNDAFSATLTRGPYLQMGNETAITIRWRTSTSQNSRVELGTTYGTYPIVVSDAASVTEHVVRVTGLNPDTKYYYRIGNSTTMGAADPDKFFTTAPPANTTRKIRIAAFGDCGRNSATYQDENLANYLNFLATNGVDAADAWILMGDNAYSSGTDAEYTNNFFGIYGNSLLKNHKLYPAPGNHDYGNNTANKPSRAMPYYNIFTVPQNGECGGVPSTKPNFYSFDIGNIHFLSLDSWGTESDGTHMGTSGTSALKTWINNDLAANTKKWTIAYWHHPPYTKTSHNSDTETELVNIRQNFISYLESRGVDLIICGHSHGYERSYLLRNFTTGWTSFTPATHAVSTSSAMYTSAASCPYVYNSTPLNHGTVYVVAGSAGASGGVQADFDAYAFPHSVNDGGVFYFEVEDNRLDAKMLRRNGTVFDQFTIIKDANTSSTQNIFAGQTATLQASWPGASNYNWSTGQTSRSISVSPPVGTHNYTVTDDYGCVADQFTVNVASILPVNLAGYDVKLVDGKARISWSTSSEVNSKSFTVERSADGVNFETLAEMNAAGQSSVEKKYAVVDPQPLKGTSYYRLTQTDMDNRSRVYEIKRLVNKTGRTFQVRMAQKGKAVVVSVVSTEKTRLTLNIYDLHGRMLQTEKWEITAGTNDRETTLGKGSYVFNFINERGERHVQKMMIQ